MDIRQVLPSDVDRLMEIFEEARYTISLLGIDQWQNGYPSRDVIEKDVELGQSYCICTGGKPCGTMVLILDGEPLYDWIDNGEWLTGSSNQNYLTIHRVAISVDCRGKGISTSMIKDASEFARQHGKTSLRIDTHHGNVVMRRMLEKNGFQACGVIYLANGDPRVAYEKIL